MVLHFSKQVICGNADGISLRRGGQPSVSPVYGLSKVSTDPETEIRFYECVLRARDVNRALSFLGVALGEKLGFDDRAGSGAPAEQIETVDRIVKNRIRDAKAKQVGCAVPDRTPGQGRDQPAERPLGRRNDSDGLDRSFAAGNLG